MSRIFFSFILLFLISCSAIRTDDNDARIYLTNSSLLNFDKSFMEVYVDDNLIMADSVNNRYLSFYWQDSLVKVPKGKFDLKVKIRSNGCEVFKDTTVVTKDSLKVFITFDFMPYYKRYEHPDIYKFFKGETTRFKEIADSLYKMNALPNADEYLNDTIPLKNSIRISVQ